MQVFSFYRFVTLQDPAAVVSAVRVEAARDGLLGTVLVAAEGINGTLAGRETAIARFRDWLAATEPFRGIDGRYTRALRAPFARLNVRQRAEIVTLGVPGLDPQRRTGQHVGPDEWHVLLDDPDTVVIDTRNDYEIDVGRFPGAVDPQIGSFREFPAFAAQHGDRLRDKPVAMYCTGGIRCEKASALLLQSGYSTVYQLDGGILGYLERVSPDENRWDGECFVFDSRVAVDANLVPGNYRQCHACRRPLSPGDLASEHYRSGVSCPHCIETVSGERLSALEERRRQRELEAARRVRDGGEQTGEMSRQTGA